MKHTDKLCESAAMVNPWLRILFFALINTCFLLIYATASSPLLPYSYSDYDIFRAVALIWKQGGLPYVDIFDNKGPMLYLFYLLGITISAGKGGLFLIEIILMTWSAELIYRIGRAMNVSFRTIFLGLTCIYALYTYMCQLGMTVEEISLPFTLLPLLYYIRKDNDGVLPLWQISVIGCCFGVVSLIRLNNSALICGLVVAEIYNMCRLRRFRYLLHEAIVFIASVAAIWLPFVGYYYAVDALDDMLYCSIVFNLSYVHKWHTDHDVLFNILNCMSCIFAMIFVAVRCDRKAACYIVPISAILLISLVPGGSYEHYFILTFPVVAYVVFYASKFGCRTMFITCCALVLPNLYYIARIHYIEIPRKFGFERSAGHPSPWEINHKCYAESLLNRIPEEEYGEIYSTLSFNETVVTYNYGVMPPGKYLCAQDRAAGITDELRKDIILKFSEADPKWVMMLCHMEKYWIISQFADRYELTDSVIPVENWLPVYYLYRRKD